MSYITRLILLGFWSASFALSSATSDFRFDLATTCRIGGRSSRSDRRLTCAVEHLFQGAHGDAQEPANLDGGDFAASGGTVRPISTQTEISLSGLWHRDRKRGDDFFVHVGFRGCGSIMEPY